MKRIVSAFILFTLTVMLVPANAFAASYTFGAVVGPTSVTRSGTATIDLGVRADTSASYLVDLEVYRPDGQKVYQTYWDNQAFVANQARSFRATWTVPSDAATGTYTIKAGLFTPNWTSFVAWSDSAGQFSVTAGGLTNGSGTGLSGQYFDNSDLTNAKVSRIDGTIDFAWGSGSPDASIGADTFSARWQGQVEPRFSETYTFATTSDDGVRLWVNGKQVVNNWTNHGATENTGTIALTAGQRYDLKLEYYDSSSGATIKLAWSSPSQTKQIVPRSQLYPASQPSTTATAAPSATKAPTAAPTATYVPTVTAVATTTSTPSTGRYFSTLPPGSKLPSDSECASAIKSRSENKGVNKTANATRGNQKLGSSFIGGDPRANTELASRVTGNFSGTTDEILQWAACKWGIDENIARAQAAKESWWRQNALGDWTTDSTRCAPGHGLGVDGRAGQCPESWGILQNRYPYEQTAWPGIQNSTAFNADTTYAIWRACYEGYEWWLNDVDRGQQYGAGDEWGCVGRWFAGRWHTQDAETYISAVKGYLNDRIWEKPEFQEP